MAYADKKEAARRPDPYWLLLREADRTDEDKKDDEARKPLELLRLLQIKAGWKVLDLASGGGYTCELLARAAGPTGKVWCQNPKEFNDKFPDMAKAFQARLARPINKSVVGVERPMDDPAAPEAKELDLAINGFVYHDTIWLGVDRDKMNKAIFAALKPGGLYVILDHAAKDGAGGTVAQTLHRVEEKLVVDEVQKAGFTLARKGDFLRNAEDPRDAGVFGPLRGKTDRFILVFQKPAK
jgi:predicted methyltransferase